MSQDQYLSEIFSEKIASYYKLSNEESDQRNQSYLENRELIHATMGLCGEAGEVMDLVKKSVNYSKPLDREKLLEECGDTLHYLARVLTEAGSSLEEAIEHNLKKLSKRFPQGYSHEAAINRQDLGH